MDGGSDHAYAAATCVWGVEAEPLLLELLAGRDVAGLRVLDAGCGEGRNAVQLARRGADVLAVDVSPLAIEHARATWGDEPGVAWQVADLRELPLPPLEYDLVVLDSVLHWMADAGDAARLVQRLCAATRPGGRHLMCVFDDRRQELAGHAVPPRFIPGHAWCLGLYAGWYLETVRRETIISAHAGAPVPHSHSVTKLVACSPEI